MAGKMGKPRKSGNPAQATVRKISLLLDLVRNKRISLRASERHYGCSERTLLRDLQELRTIGETAGFRISDRQPGDIFELSEFKAQPTRLVGAEKRLRQLIAELLKAFGEPAVRAAGDIAKTKDGDPSFLRIVQPQLVDGSAVGTAYEQLESAWHAGARVEFRYRGELRTVEPAAAIARAGRYYLVARDVAKGAKGWRIFAMDQIGSPIKRAGTISRKIEPPPKYLSTDTVGWFKGDRPSTAIEVTFSKTLAPAAKSRTWQQAQEVRENGDGTVTLRLRVDDVDEVIRWALSYGDEAWITSPPQAVARAKKIVENVAARY